MKIRAFTILEMIINLALMSIIVSLVYVVYGYFSQNMKEYTIMTSENFLMASFNTRLKEDFYQADKIFSIGEKKITVIFYDEVSVAYRQEGQYLYRESDNSLDSIRSNGMTFTLLNPEVSTPSSKLVKNVRIDAELYGKEVPLFAYKNYFSNNMIKKDEY